MNARPYLSNIVRRIPKYNYFSLPAPVPTALHAPRGRLARVKESSPRNTTTNSVETEAKEESYLAEVKFEANS